MVQWDELTLHEDNTFTAAWYLKDSGSPNIKTSTWQALRYHPEQRIFWYGGDPAFEMLHADGRYVYCSLALNEEGFSLGDVEGSGGYPRQRALPSGLPVGGAAPNTPAKGGHPFRLPFRVWGQNLRSVFCARDGQKVALQRGPKGSPIAHWKPSACKSMGFVRDGRRCWCLPRCLFLWSHSLLLPPVPVPCAIGFQNQTRQQPCDRCQLACSKGSETPPLRGGVCW